MFKKLTMMLVVVALLFGAALPAVAAPCAIQPDGTCKPFEYVPDENGREGGTIRWDYDDWLREQEAEQAAGNTGATATGYRSGTAEVPVVFVDKRVVTFPDALPINKAGRWLVPIRAIVETMGASITYDEAKVTITRPGLSIVLPFGGTVATVNGQQIILDAPAEVVAPGRTMVPLRFVAEAFGATVDYVGANAPAHDPTFTGRHQVWIWVPWGEWGAKGLYQRLPNDWNLK